MRKFTQMPKRGQIEQGTNRRAIRRRILAGLLLTFAATRTLPAQYLDPGGGSYIFQILIAGLAVAVFYFSRIKEYVAALIRKLRSRKGGE